MKKPSLFQFFALILTFILIFISSCFLFQKTLNLKTNSNQTSDEFELNWSHLIQQIGPSEAYQKFKATNLSERSRSHLDAHRFGKILYKYAGKDGVLICDESFSYGCYHGFFESAISSEGIGIIEELDSLCNKRYGSGNLGCQHGIGHGILEYTGHSKLTKALDICRKISRGKYLGCLSGIFMEYNFPTLIDGEQIIFSKRNLKNDEYYPCSQIPNDFKKLCYFEQPQLWTVALSKNYQYLGELCMNLPEEYKNICYRGVGNATGKDTNFSYEKMGEDCNMMPDENSQSYCFAGVTWSLMIRNEHLQQSRSFCEKAPDTQICNKYKDLTQEPF